VSLATALTQHALDRTLTWTEVESLLGEAEVEARRDREWDAFLARADLVELVAHQRFRFYRLIGGTERTRGSYRAEIRLCLATGKEI
jgi:hypothetical protein